MKVFIVGGTGFLGYYTVRVLREHGHEVSTMALPPLPQEGLLPAEVDVSLGDYRQMSDGELERLIAGCDGLIFAAGVDDRVVPKAPAYPFFYEGNVIATRRWIRLAKRAGIKRAVIFNSYFATMDERWPELKLAEKHVYIRSRREQISASLAEAGVDMTVSFLMLPYIFGSMPGRTPLWKPLIAYLNSFLPVLFYPAGGSAMVSVDEVGQAAVGALEHGEHGCEYEIVAENLTWKEMIARLLMGVGKRKPVVILPKFMVRLGGWLVKQYHHARGLEGGLDLPAFVEVQTRHAYLNPGQARKALGYSGADLDEAFRATMLACVPEKVKEDAAAD